MATVDRTLPWLGFPAAVDLANTVVVDSGAAVDLLTREEELGAWIEAEQPSFPQAEAARGFLPEVRALRDVLRRVLFAAAAGGPLPRAGIEALNAASAAAPGYPVLGERGMERMDLAPDRFTAFRAAVARSAIELLAGPDGERLAVCPAPSCGLLFLRHDPRQAWCCRACGNRARVARHAARTRGAARRQ